MKKIYGILYALLSSAAFGFMPIFAKTLYNSGINTVTVLSFRFLLAALILLIYFLITKTTFKVNQKQLIILVLIGILGYTTTGLALFYSYNYISVGVATTMHFVYPAVVIVLNYFIYKEGFTKNKVIALLISITGIYVLIGVNAQDINLVGAILALLSGFTYAGCVMGMNHKEIKKISNLVTVFYFSTFAGISLLLISIFNRKLYFPITSLTVISITGISVVSTIISISLFVKALKIIGPASTSILGTFEPIVSIIMGIILFSEKITLTLFIGTFLILLSVVILAKEKEE